MTDDSSLSRTSDSVGASRRTFLAGAGLGGLITGAGVVLAGGPADAAPAPEESATFGDSIGLELDGAPVGLLRAASGGEAVGVVAVDPPSGASAPKHIAGVAYEDIRIAFGTGMSSAFYAWIAAFTRGSASAHDGRITVRGQSLTPVSVQRFTSALIRSVTFPILAGSNKGKVGISVDLAPSTTVAGGKGGPRQNAPTGPALYSFSYKLTIDGLACKRTERIGALTVRRDVGAAEPTTPHADADAAAMSYSNLVITLPLVDAQPLFDWHKAHVIENKNDERSGRLEFLNSAQTEVLFSLTFTGLGIIKIEAPQARANVDVPLVVTAEMYCEGITFTRGVA